MRIVLDANVLISGIFFAGPPGQILDAWSGDRVQLVTSPEILEEYRRVANELGRKYPQIQVQPVLDVLTATCEICLALLSGNKSATTQVTTSSWPALLLLESTQ